MFGNEFNNSNDWINEIFKSQEKSKAKTDFVSTGIKGLDAAISEIIQLNEKIQAIGKK
ncbi:MAG: hypothetical protein ACRBCJ_14945 [Hyphomicrobiaceae bacterium]